MGNLIQSKVGQIMGAIAILLFVGNWTVKAIVERKAASTEDVTAALIVIYAFYSDPKKALHIGLGAIGRIAGSDDEEMISHEEN